MEAVETTLIKTSQYTFSNLLAMLYATTVAACLAISNKIVYFHGLLIAGAVFTFPLLYFFGDIIAETYGYKAARKLIWYTLLCGALFSGLITAIIYMPSPTFDNHQLAFQEVLGNSIKLTIVGVIAMLAGSFSNAYIISKWKILVKGKYFWIRSITSSMVGEFINTLFAFPLAFGGTMPVEKIINIMIVAYVIKILYAIVAVFPATLIVAYIKTKIGVDVYDYNTNFNPFKLN